MVLIRRTQLDAFRDAALRSFEGDMLRHCRDFSPLFYQGIGEEQLRLAIRQAIRRAGTHGFTHRGPVRLFIEMVLLFGSACDTDPQYPWIAATLGSNAPQMQRAKRLHDDTRDYLSKGAHPEVLARRAVERIAAWTESARFAAELSREDVIARARLEAVRLYPEKATGVGAAVLDRLFQAALVKAAACRIVTTEGMALLCLLFFALGHGCAIDPLYPWIEGTLTDERIVDPAARGERLQREATAWFARVIASH